jgi:hypothetical protein
MLAIDRQPQRVAGTISNSHVFTDISPALNPVRESVPHAAAAGASLWLPYERPALGQLTRMKRGTRTTRTLAAGALLVALALPMAAVPTASACSIFVDSCAGEFAQLTADITTYVPVQYAGSMLSRVAQAQYPTDPLQPGDPYRVALLGSVRSQVVGLGVTGQVSAAGVAAITADIDNLVPPNPI